MQDYTDKVIKSLAGTYCSLCISCFVLRVHVVVMLSCVGVALAPWREDWRLNSLQSLICMAHHATISNEILALTLGSLLENTLGKNVLQQFSHLCVV